MIYILSNTPDLFPEFEYVNYEYLLNWLQNKPVIGIDSETTGLSCHSHKLLCFQIGNYDNQFILDIESGISLEPLKEWFKSDVIKIGANLKFDIKFLLKNNIEIKNIYDVFLAECILTTGLDNRELGLGAIAKKYLDVTLDKFVRGEIIWKGLNTRTIQYSANDVKYLEGIMNCQSLEIYNNNLTAVLNLENEVTIAFAKMEFNGIYLNRDKWLALEESAKLKVKDSIKELDSIVVATPKLKEFCSSKQLDFFSTDFEQDTNIKWSSPKQCNKVFKTLGLLIDSTNEKEINKYSKDYPLINKFIEYKKTQKLVTTYGEKFLNNINKNTNKIHTNIWQILETGRISSNEPNLQNIPANNNYLGCFEAGERYKFVSIDYSQQELRLIAEFSQDPIWIEAFLSGKDLHGELAAKTFNIDISQVKDKPDFLRGKSYRDVQKTINFGLAYGMTEFKLSKTLDIPVEQAKEFIDNYFRIVPKVKIFLNSLAKYGKQNYYIKTAKPFRRIRFFEDISHLKYVDWKKYYTTLGSIERESMNTTIQGSGADMAKQAVVNCERIIETLDFKPQFTLQIHDALIYRIEENRASEWAKIQDNCMKGAGRLIIKSIPVETDITITDVWMK